MTFRTKDDPEKQREYRRCYRERHREAIRARDRAAKKANRLYYREQARKYRERHPEKAREYQEKYKRDGRTAEARLMSRYGLGLEEFNSMLGRQGGTCAVCGLPFGEKRMYVDHCHVSDRVRGIVHMECNTLMGLAHDNPTLLEQAAAYLRRHR